MKINRIILWLLISPLHLFAQELAEKNFDHYSTSTGMSHNEIIEIAQDRTGYIWAATSSGLNRFNGSRFVQFHSNDDSLSLASDALAGMDWLDEHRLGVFTTGLHIIDTRTGNTRNLFIPYHNKQYQFKFNMLVRAKGDKHGNIYILTRSGFYHYDKDYKLVSRFDFYSEEEVPVTHFYYGRGLFELDEVRLVIVSIAGLYIYNKEERRVKKMAPEDSPLLAEFLDYPNNDYQFFQHKPGQFFVLKSRSDTLAYINIPENRKVISRLPFKTLRAEFSWRTKMMAANDTTLYLTGHLSGFYKMSFDPVSGKVKLNPEKFFKSYLCTGLLKDKEQNLWIATIRGLFRQNPQREVIEIVNLPTGTENKYPNIRVDDIYVSDGKIYAGTRGEGGLFIYDKKSLQLDEHVTFKLNDFRVNHIRAIVPVDHSTLLLGTIGPLMLFDLETKKQKHIIPPGFDLPGDWISDMYKDRRGNIWISSQNIYRYEPATKKFINIPNLKELLSVPFMMSEDTAGHIWMAGHGLARYNTVLDSFDLVLDSFPYVRMPDKQINAFVIDNKNKVWFNSNNNGLTNYDIATGNFRNFTRADGLPDDNIAAMIVVGNKLWIACYTGIACLDLNTYQIVSFGKEDGFPDMTVIKGARFFYDRPMQQLYIGFASEFARFNPAEMLRKKSPPHTFIESLVINGKKTNFLPGQDITTSWKDNEIRITIGTINFSDGNIQRFAYRIIKDYETPWTLMGNQSSFNISSLSPGTHRIQVKSYSPNNRWPEQVKEISITVLPPVWKKDWFIVMSGAGLLALIFLMIKWRTNVATRKEMEKTQIEKLKADDYKNQFELEQISNYFSSSLADKKTEEEVLWDVTNNLIARMNYVDCMIYLWNKDKTKMIQKAAYGPKGKPELITTQVFDVVPGQGIVGHVIKTRQPILLSDTRKDPRYRVDEQFRLSEVCVPIIHNDELMGIIDSEHHQPNYFSERDIKILTTIATLIGNKLKQIQSEQSLEVKREELANINEQLAEARLSALQAQMNPHFVFNALNSIKSMILDGDNEKASVYLSKFARMIRMTLNQSKDLFVTLDENIEYLKAYLEMEQLRFDDSFTYKIVTDENIDTEETTIPSLMIQPLVENAIWHGLMPSGPDKKILIGFTQAEDSIVCTIEDNGVGIRHSEKIKETNKSGHHSVGLENLQKRIKIINEKYEADCSLQITDLGEEMETANGTKVVLRFRALR